MNTHARVRQDADLFGHERRPTLLCLSLHQPWAWLIAVGLKRFETRSWSTRHRGPIGIHATKAFPGYAQAAAEHGAIRAALAGNGLAPEDLPRGVLVAVARLAEVVPCEALPESAIGREADFGNFAAGRFAWRLDRLRPLAAPIAINGKQGLWTWPDPPGELGRLAREVSA